MIFSELEHNTQAKTPYVYLTYIVNEIWLAWTKFQALAIFLVVEHHNIF